MRKVSAELAAEVRQRATLSGDSFNTELRRIMHPREGKCLTCKGPTRLSENRYKAGFLKCCSNQCAAANPDRQKKIQATCLQNLGVTNAMQSAAVNAKREQTMTDRYGAANTASSPVLRAKMRATLQENHGVSETWLIPEVVEAGSAWKKDPKRIKQMTERYKATCQERYGVDHAFHLADVVERQQRTAFKLKALRLKGKTFEYQGYEDVAIKHLINNLGCKPFEVLTGKGEVPRVAWVDSKGVTRMYFPDIYAKVRGEWFVVEVKSTYTAGLLKRNAMFYTLRRKLRAVEEAGYNVRLIVVDDGVPYIHRGAPSSIKDLRGLCGQ